MLQPYISQTFNSTVWRLQIDGQKGIMAVELRNEQDKQTSFASLNLTTGQVYFDSLVMPERWLTGIEAVYNGIMLLHYYKHESGPEHKTIIAIDAKTAAEVWSNYNLAFDHLSVNGPVSYNTGIQPKKLLLIDILTGQTLRQYDAMQDKPFETEIVIPYMMPASQLVPGSLPAEPYGNMVHYLNHNSYRIVSLHTLKNGELLQLLYILKGTEVVYYDLLNQHIQKLQPEAFVLHKNSLIYIKNKAEIKVLEI
ncbi:DUF4905 domain-containing protein [Mucilaginibacter rigui]|uniref:DUF4905 domain-containing protein n=2 Tax=Mucilaginibacter rigui TaxID=534635 RepID=A0ABR7X7R6_9SPHI|nr:DUF4905 domain-containing protein [Mucilaginibacter rigui]